MLFPSVILKKPIACSNVLSLNSFFFLISSREFILPSLSLYSIILSIFFFVIPETYLSREGEAVFILTPTLLTAFVTTKSSDSVYFLFDTSC